MKPDIPDVKASEKVRFSHITPLIGLGALLYYNNLQ